MSNSKTYLISFLAGMIFALGLIISNMLTPISGGFFADFWSLGCVLALWWAVPLTAAMPAFMMAKRKANNHQLAYDGNDINLPNKLPPRHSWLWVASCLAVSLVGFCPAPVGVGIGRLWASCVIFGGTCGWVWGHSIAQNLELACKLSA